MVDYYSYIDLTKINDSYQKGVNCLMLTKMLIENPNIFSSFVDNNLNQFLEYTFLTLKELREGFVILHTRELSHPVVINPKHPFDVVLLKMCIALYGLLSGASLEFVYARLAKRAFGFT